MKNKPGGDLRKVTIDDIDFLLKEFAGLINCRSEPDLVSQPEIRSEPRPREKTRRQERAIRHE